ncbi:MAG: hypothetical protein AABW41_02885 [Nanoarchaeota archaeon]
MTEKKSDYKAESIQVLMKLQDVRSTYDSNCITDQTKVRGSIKPFIIELMVYKIEENNDRS